MLLLTALPDSQILLLLDRSSRHMATHLGRPQLKVPLAHRAAAPQEHCRTVSAPVAAAAAHRILAPPAAVPTCAARPCNRAFAAPSLV